MKLLAVRLTRELRAMSDETEAAVLRELPDIEASADPVLRRRMIEATFKRVLALLAGTGDAATDADLHVGFGAAAARAGVPLETLTAGYRIGARVGWAHVREAVQALTLDADVVLAIADAHVAFVHELAANSVEGYTREAELAGGERAHERQALLDALLMSDVLEDEPAARRAAEAAGWPWAERVAVAILLARPRRAAPNPRLILGSVGRAAVAVGPPLELESWLARVAVPAAVGTAEPLSLAPSSLARARRVAGLTAAGVLPADRVVRWEDELATLIVHADPAAAAALAASLLTPLDDPSPARTRLLRETLSAWLDHPGQPLAIARALHLHPQSVRYRLTRLRERLGDRLDDPAARFELGLALRFSASPLPPTSAPPPPPMGAPRRPAAQAPASVKASG